MDDEQPSLYTEYSPIQVGDRVRFYHPDEYFDDGRVGNIDSEGKIYVDFLDWIECWDSDEVFVRGFIAKGRYQIHTHGRRVIDFWF